MWPLIAAGALSAAGNFFGSKSAASAQSKAADLNARMQQETNAQNLAMYHDSRGANGSAILPEYMRGSEAEFGGQAADLARALFGYGGGPQGQLAAGEGMLQRYNPALEAGDNTVIDLATGRTGAARQASLAPVLAARSGLAKGRAASINQSLDATLAGLCSSRAAAGFRGSSTFDTNRALAATVGARAAAAGELGQANLDNALAKQGTDENKRQWLVNSLDLPFQRGQQRLSFNNLPASAAASAYTQAMSPLNFWRLPNGNPPQQVAPQMPVVPNTGQIAGAAVGGIGQSIGQYLAQQQMMQQLQKMYGGGGGSPTSWVGPGGGFDGSVMPSGGIPGLY